MIQHKQQDTRHNTTLLRHPHTTGYHAHVDLAIAPLVLALWKHNIHTTLSCQEAYQPRIAYITFKTPQDNARFLQAALQTTIPKIVVNNQITSYFDHYHIHEIIHALEVIHEQNTTHTTNTTNH